MDAGSAIALILLGSLVLFLIWISRPGASERLGKALARWYKSLSPHNQESLVSLGRDTVTFVRVVFRIVFVIALISGVFALLFEGYQSVDEAGYITHSRETPVGIDGQWLIGEVRKCSMVTRAFDKNDSDLPSMGCYIDAESSGNLHRLEVRYWGRIDRDKAVIHWKCRRNETSVTCWALD